MGSLSLLQRIFLTQESNWGLLHCRWILYQLSYEGLLFIIKYNNIYLNYLNIITNKIYYLFFLPITKSKIRKVKSTGNSPLNYVLISGDSIQKDEKNH